MAATFSFVVIDESSAATVSLGTVTPGQIVRLHELCISLGTAGTVKIQQTNAGALTGAMDVLAKCPLYIPFRDRKEHCLKCGSGRALEVVVTQAAKGYAIISTDTN